MSKHPTLVMGHIVCLGPDDEEGIPYDEAVIHLEGDEDSEIEVHCPGALPLAEKIVKAVNSHEALVKALTDARAAIASLPMEMLGYASDPSGAQIHSPIRDELLHRIDTALNAEPPVNGVVASGQEP